MTNTAPPSRIAGLDALRGIAVILMMQQHIGVWLWDMGRVNLRTVLAKHPLMVGLNATGGMAAPLFILLAGIGTELFCRQVPQCRRKLAVRGAALLIIGYALNLSVPSWFTPGSWYVLQLIGLGLVVCAVLHRWPAWRLLILAGVLLAVTPLLQQMLDTPPAMSNRRMGDFSLQGGVMRLVLVEGHFPVFPWLALVLAGKAAGRAIAEGRWKTLMISGAGAMALGGALALAATVAHPAQRTLAARYLGLTSRIYPLQPPLALLLWGGAGLLCVLFCRIRSIPRPVDALAALGRCSLTFFIAHILLFRQGLIALGSFRRLSASGTGWVLFAVIVISLLLASLWQRANFRFGLEWLIRRFDAVVRQPIPQDR